ncbi:MAG: ABC transporter ATP-binding protein [Gammaproteobacteria bacterium]
MESGKVTINNPLSVSGITVRFGGVTALSDVSFAVERGQLLGLIGPNGAGKSTLMKVITGEITPARGSVYLNGEKIDGLPTHKRVRGGLGMSQQITRPFRDMTVVQNVSVAAGYDDTISPVKAFLSVDRKGARTRAMQLLDLVGIRDAADSMPAHVPLGYLKRLELARALALDPGVLLLDEPLAGLNQAEAATLADTILNVISQGRTVVLVEHNLGEVVRVCSHLIVLDNGRILAEGFPEEVMAQPDVKAAYLGREVANA